MTRVRELILILGLGACASNDGASEPTVYEPRMAPLVWPGIVSGPVSNIGSVSGNAWSGPVTYISARPGTLGSASSVGIAGPHSGSMRQTAYVKDGGFDPVPVFAAAGDTVRIYVVEDNVISAAFLARVPATSEPVVVRAEPSSDVVDVPLNAQFGVVFSEPVVMTPGILRLFHDGIAVTGVAQFAFPNIAARFLTDTTLRAATAYYLEISTLVRGEHGSLAVPWRSRFTTRAAPRHAELAIDSFTVIEFQDPNDHSGAWLYAPRIRVRETTGLGALRVVDARFDNSTQPMCISGVDVLAGQSRDVFREIYGEYQPTFEEWNGARMTTREMAVTLRYVDETGRTADVSAIGRVVPGTAATTYTVGGSSISFNPSCYA